MLQDVTRAIIMKTILFLFATVPFFSQAAEKLQWQVLKSSVFAGTVRQYAFHKTPGLDAAKAAALMVFQDGHSYVEGNFHAPEVIDKLVQSGAVPPMLLVFVNPGVFADDLAEPQGWNTPKGLKSKANSNC